MAQQADPDSTPGDTGNLNAFTIANRWYPIMFSRAGLALQQEYSFVRSNGVTNQGGAFEPCVPTRGEYSTVPSVAAA